MPDDARPALESILGALAGQPYDALLATNSLRISWDADEAMPDGRRCLWVDPPWRLLQGEDCLAGTADCPRWDDFVSEPADASRRDEEGRSAYAAAFEAWGRPFGFLEESPIVGFTVAAGLPDLTIRFACGRRIETFGSATTDIWWYYADLAGAEDLEATASGIARHARGAARPDPH